LRNQTLLARGQMYKLIVSVKRQDFSIERKSQDRNCAY